MRIDYSCGALALCGLLRIPASPAIRLQHSYSPHPYGDESYCDRQLCVNFSVGGELLESPHKTSTGEHHLMAEALRPV